MPQLAAKVGGRRLFTKPGTKAYDALKWAKQDAFINNPLTGQVAFEQKGVEFPAGWSLNAVNIVAQKYFWGTPGTKERETSLKHLVDRVADTITRHGEQEGYFEDAVQTEDFREELKYILASQRAAFNSPVWFNIGAPGRSQQASACFILAVEDNMPSILNWYTEEGMIFKGGSGSGINLSSLRSRKERLGGSGGYASGPVSFMRGADSSAGTIKSGGKTRRAAKMVILNVGHPDVEEFIWCKAIEERKARVLQEAGYDMDLDGKDSFSVQYQNANNSVRVTDEFMQAVVGGDKWELKAIKDGKTVETVDARALWRQIAEASWECADPGLQFDTTVNKWHTTPNAGRIDASNPCSEYMHLNNSACNLASINLLKYLREDGSFDVAAFNHTVDIMFTAQEILVGYSEYPTEKITENAKAYRELGLGYANLGALLMAQGIPYDSEDGRAQAAAITALMTGRSYAMSARLSQKVGPFAGYHKDRKAMNNVIRMHRDEVKSIDPSKVNEELLSAAASAWDEAVELAELYGVRNSQATLLAPTGTIAFFMDCDTTGIEPDFALTKYKKLVGGGSMVIVNQTVPRALHKLGYNDAQSDEIVSYIHENSTIVGAPHLKDEHYPVFACAVGDNAIHYSGHVRMMGAVQPFLSGAISKTVNMPEEVSVEDIEQLHMDAWKLGLKAVAVYRDNCKVGQPLSSSKKGSDKAPTKDEPELVATVAGRTSVPRELPKIRNSKTFQFKVADSKGYFTVTEFEDGAPGELFISISKMGSTLRGLMDAFAIAISHGLQLGVPLRTYVHSFTSMSFAPSGITDDPDIRTATSLIDYIFRRLAMTYLSFDDRLELGLASIDDMPVDQTSLLEDAPVAEAAEVEKASPAAAAVTPPLAKVEPVLAAKVNGPVVDPSAPLCTVCGNQTQRAGTCYVCTSCGTTTGCS